MKIGLALGGGGAKGFAHLGVLRVLDELGVKPDIVVGTSIGALVGAAYAAGQLEKLTERAHRIKISEIPLLLSPTWSRKGLFSGNSALHVLDELIEGKSIEDLPIRFAAVAGDLNHARAVTLDSGDIRTAVRASIAIPGLFTPIHRGDNLLVDGGTYEPLPVRIARELGADIVIAVDLFGDTTAFSDILGMSRSILPARVQTALEYFRSISEKLHLGNVFSGWDGQPTDSANPNIIDIFERTLAVSQQTLTRARLREFPADVVIAPAVSHISLLDFHRGKEVTALGVTAAQLMQDELRSYCKET